MMTKSIFIKFAKLVTLLALLTLLYLFQNCGHFTNSSKKDLTIMVSEPVKPVSITKPLSIKLTDVKSIIFYNVLNNELMTDKNKIYRPDVFSLHLDPISGRIEAFDVTEKLLKTKFCLQEVERRELTNLLNIMQLCEPQMASDEDLLNNKCDLKYKMPYAKFLFEREVFNLGEKTSECSHSYDICGDHAISFKNFIRKIIINLKNKKC